MNEVPGRTYYDLMSPFAFARSEAAGWSAVAKELESGLALSPLPDGMARLGLLYVTDILAEDLASLLTYLRQTLAVDHWSGSIGIGICTSQGEIFDAPAAAALVVDLPAGSFAVMPPITSGVGELPADIRAWMSASTPPFAIVHGDPTNPNVPDLIETLAMEMETATLEIPGFLVGGLTSSRRGHYQIADGVSDGGLSGVMFAPAVEVATSLTQGCAPVGAAHRITEGADNIIISLDGEPALEVFKRDIGELLARDLARVAGYIHAAFPIEGSDTGDYLVRNLLAIDPEHGWLAVAGPVVTGERVLFVRRDPIAAEEDLRRMVRDLKARLPGPPRGGVYFTCVARGPQMFGAEGGEMGVIREILGDVPVVGFYGQGEISNNRLYGYTGVLTLFL